MKALIKKLIKVRNLLDSQKIPTENRLIAHTDENGTRIFNMEGQEIKENQYETFIIKNGL